MTRADLCFVIAAANGFDWWAAFAGAFIGTIVAWCGKAIARWFLDPRLAIVLHQDEYGRFVTKEKAHPDLKVESAVGQTLSPTEFHAHIQRQIFSQETTDVIYLRLRVRNTNERAGFAKNCAVFLTDIEHSADGMTFERIYFDSIELRWSYGRNIDPNAVDIPHGVDFFVDLLSTRQGSPQFVPAVHVLPLAYSTEFQKPGTYRFRITAVAENAKPTTKTIDVEWNAVWNEFNVSTPVVGT